MLVCCLLAHEREEGGGEEDNDLWCRFILSIQRHDEMNLTAAFPNTFGISPHIDMCKRDDKEDQENNE